MGRERGLANTRRGVIGWEELFTNAKGLISIGQKIISRKLLMSCMVDKFFSSGVSAETILQESLEEVKFTLS